MDTILLEMLWICDFFVFEAVVIESSVLVAPMTESIPLAPALCIYMDYIIVSNKAERLKVLKRMLRLFSRKARLMDALEMPTARH